MSTALAHVCEGMTVDDLLTIELPHLSQEDREYVLWEYTGWPAFFAGPLHPVNELRRQLVEWREGKAKHTDELVAELKAKGEWPIADPPQAASPSRSPSGKEEI